jgi:AraC family transcriptional regulator of adaptative response/methylated-DNA-[protein]-cysteine methyltransferase
MISATPNEAMSRRPTSPILAPEAWRAVEDRDASADGRFVFAVRTTGVYCRPSCPARRPRRENVTFYAKPGQAEAAGFRPCRRCRPQSVLPSPAAQRVELAVEYLDEHLDDAVTLAELGREVGMSPTHLQRTFKRFMGVSPAEYVRARRLERLKSGLQRGEKVLDATFEAGYGAASRAYDAAAAPLGMTPATYRAGGRGMHVYYAFADSPLGRLLVGATERGVAAVMLGDSDGELEAALREEYPNARLEPSRDGLEEWTEAVVATFDGPGETLDLPLDVQATTFQWRVWKALRDIPRGETRSYGEIAAAIGAPRSTRAVARACATNPVALTVPCHRVVRKDGGLGGYRWGEGRKRRLLERERAE